MVRGSTNPENLVPRATKFRTVATNIFSLITAFFLSLSTETCISSQAPRRKRQMTVQLTRRYRIVCLQ